MGLHEVNRQTIGVAQLSPSTAHLTFGFLGFFFFDDNSPSYPLYPIIQIGSSLPAMTTCSSYHSSSSTHPNCQPPCPSPHSSSFNHYHKHPGHNPSGRPAQHQHHSYQDMSELRLESWLLDEEADKKSVAALFKTKKKPITDILIWVQCFASYVAVLAQSFPTHTPKFMAYLATIVRCHHRFEGLAGYFKTQLTDVEQQNRKTSTDLS